MARSTIRSTAALAVSMSALEEAYAVLAAAMAVLVADGASPTQAHVTTANNALTTVTAILGGDFILDYNRSNITTFTQLEQATRAALDVARGIQR